MARIEAELVIEAGRALVSLGGALDVSNAHRLGALLRRLIREGCSDIVVDLAAVESVDAAGVGILRGAARALASGDGDGRLCFRNAPGDLAAFLANHGIYEAGGGPVTDGRPGAAVTRQAVERRPPSPRQPGRTTRSPVPRR